MLKQKQPKTSAQTNDENVGQGFAIAAAFKIVEEYSPDSSDQPPLYDAAYKLLAGLHTSSQGEDSAALTHLHNTIRAGERIDEGQLATAINTGQGVFPAYSDEHRVKRNKYIRELVEEAREAGCDCDEVRMSDYLKYLAERLLLIDVPITPDNTVQPLWHPDFIAIDHALQDQPLEDTLLDTQLEVFAVPYPKVGEEDSETE